MIAGAAPSHVNNFTLLRIAAAVAVIVTHCYDLQRLEDIAYRSTGFRFGVWAVDVFFVISGYLVLTSFERRKDVVAFVRARALRILPGLWVMLIVTTIILGLFFTTLPAKEFFADFRTTQISGLQHGRRRRIATSCPAFSTTIRSATTSTGNSGR